MKVAELKELLKAAGKPVSGKKADLIARLERVIARERSFSLNTSESKVSTTVQP